MREIEGRGRRELINDNRVYFLFPFSSPFTDRLSRSLLPFNLPYPTLPTSLYFTDSLSFSPFSTNILPSPSSLPSNITFILFSLLFLPFLLTSRLIFSLDPHLPLPFHFSTPLSALSLPFILPPNFNPSPFFCSTSLLYSSFSVLPLPPPFLFPTVIAGQH